MRYIIKEVKVVGREPFTVKDWEDIISVYVWRPPPGEPPVYFLSIKTPAEAEE